jgi:hypothetical protein
MFVPEAEYGIRDMKFHHYLKGGKGREAAAVDRGGGG